MLALWALAFSSKQCQEQGRRLSALFRQVSDHISSPQRLCAISSILISKHGKQMLHAQWEADWIEFSPVLSLNLLVYYKKVRWAAELGGFPRTELVKSLCSQVTLSRGQGHTQRSLTAAPCSHFAWPTISAPSPLLPPPHFLCPATSWAAKSIPPQLSIAALCYSKQVWIHSLSNSNKITMLNECPQPSQFNIWLRKAKLMMGVGWGDCLRFGVTEPAHFVWDSQTHRWFSLGFVVVHKEEEKNVKNKIALHHLWVGSKINVFGLQMPHKGILIYSVLWCITAQSDISNWVGCVQVIW